MDRKSVLDFLKTHKEQLTQQYGVEKIGLFGSLAEGRENPQSDLDFYVCFRQKSFRNLAGLYRYLETSLKRPIDIITEHPHMRPGLRREIEKSVCYG
jgi:predicted nucleotidyltransferase